MSVIAYRCHETGCAIHEQRIFYREDVYIGFLLYMTASHST